MITNYPKMSNYEDLEEYFRLFKDSPDFTLTFNKKGITITFKALKYKITISEKDLNNLIEGKPILNNIFYHKTYGFTSKSFSEICIGVTHPKYLYTGDESEWPIAPKRFAVGNTIYEVGRVSPLFVLLFEPVYRDSDFNYNFHERVSLKILGTQVQNFKQSFTKGLYYLNSSILKRIGFIARPNSVEFDDSGPFDPWNNDIDEVFKQIQTNKFEFKHDLISIEPLAFYNHAQQSSGHERFLYLYRILEFFMHRARVKKVSELRYKHDVDEKEIIEFIENKNEERLLFNLLDESLASIKTSLIESAIESKIIAQKDFKLFCTVLYKYRNSLIHAKELRITEAIIPDPFAETEYDDFWINTLDEIVIKIIRKYNRA